MSLVRKLKPDNAITGLIVPLSVFAIFAVVALASGMQTALTAVAIAIWVHSLFYLLVFIRTGNGPHLFSFAYQVFLGYFCLNIVDIATLQTREYILAFAFGLVFFLSILIYFAARREIKWRGREVFELAAESIEDEGNGYTTRPRPVGKVTYSRQEILSFARFAARRLIALPYITAKNITLVPVKSGDEYGRLLGLSGDYRDATWVNFDTDGSVSVHISQKDYLDYRQSLAFDSLCSSLGQLFIDFIALHQRGEGVKIIDRMNDLHIGAFS